MRFGKEHRVRKRAEYRKLQEVGCRVSTPHFVLLAAKNAAQDGSRLGITASRKVGCAVRRNRLKRLVREAYRAYPGVVPPGVDLVVICRKDDPSLGREQVIAEWRRASQRLEHLLASPPSARSAPRARRQKKAAAR